MLLQQNYPSQDIRRRSPSCLPKTRLCERGSWMQAMTSAAPKKHHNISQHCITLQPLYLYSLIMIWKIWQNQRKPKTVSVENCTASQCTDCAVGASVTSLDYTDMTQLHHVTSQPATYSDTPCLGTYLQWDQVRRELCQAGHSSYLPPVDSQIWKCLGGDTTWHHSIKMYFFSLPLSLYMYIFTYIQYYIITDNFGLQAQTPPSLQDSFSHWWIWHP